MSQATRVLGCSPMTARYVYSYISFSPNSVFEQSLRWKRKPIWLPTAKSKMFRVPTRPVVPLEEVEEMKRLFNQYRTVVKSVRKHMMRLVEEKNVQQDPLIIEKAKEDDFKACSNINDEWNKKISLEREERLAREREIRREKIIRGIALKEQRKEEQIKKATEEIRKAKEQVSTFITSSTIDQAIEEALNNVVDHNFAIDLDGNKYTGDDLEVIQNQSRNKEKAQASQ